MEKFSFKSIIIGISIVFGSTNFVLSQGSGGVNITLNNSNMGAFDLYSSPAWQNVVITDRPLTSTSYIGSPFINQEWKLADIIVTENKGVIANVPVRIDAQENLIEITSHENVVKVLKAERVYSLTFKTEEDVFVSNTTLGVVGACWVFQSHLQ